MGGGHGEHRDSGVSDPGLPPGLPYKGMQGYVPKDPPNNPIAKALNNFFKVYERNSTFLTEIRAGCVLFMTSAYILFLNPLILSGGSSSFATGMPASDVALATSLATGIGTTIMGVMGNYPWVISTQLGTNSYFVINVLQLGVPCGAHSTFKGGGAYADLPCQCTLGPDGVTPIPISPPANDPAWKQNDSQCTGTKVPFEQALACTFLEGLVFMAICLFGVREFLLKMVPRSVLIAGACGIGFFISFVGSKDSGIIVGAPYPTALQLMTDWPYVHGGWGQPGHVSGVGFNSCQLYFDGPPYSVICPWLAVGGLIFTAILMLWDIHGAFIIGIFFTTFISWIKFPGKLNSKTDPGLVPSDVAGVPKFTTTLGVVDFNWGENTNDLIGAFFLFLYLDFIGSSITFVAMGEMMGIVDDDGNIPRANMAFLSDGTATMIGGLLGSSALTTYVESAAAVREGGRTGLTAIVCALFFFASCFLSNLFGQIPSIATGPILMLIGLLIFISAIMDIDWSDLTEAMPAYATILGMPLTHNIAYGVIAGVFMWFVAKLFTYQMHPSQEKWPGCATYKKRALHAKRGMFMPIPGFNVNVGPEGPQLPWVPFWYDLNVTTFVRRYILNSEPRSAPAYTGTDRLGGISSLQMPLKDSDISVIDKPMKGDDSAHPVNGV